MEEPGDLLEAPYSPAGVKEAVVRCPSPTQSDIVLVSDLEDTEFDLNATIGFGKHGDTPLCDVHRKDPDYLKWLVRKVSRCCARPTTPHSKSDPHTRDHPPGHANVLASRVRRRSTSRRAARTSSTAS